MPSLLFLLGCTLSFISISISIGRSESALLGAQLIGALRFLDAFAFPRLLTLILLRVGSSCEHRGFVIVVNCSFFLPTLNSLRRLCLHTFLLTLPLLRLLLSLCPGPLCSTTTRAE